MYEVSSHTPTIVWREREHRGRGREAERTEEEESRDRQERKEDSRRKGRTDVFERGGQAEHRS